MLEENRNSFDDLVRSMLEDAEEKAPRRVWRGVSARLDAAAAWWKWAAAGLVAACALAGGLFFGGVFDKTAAIADSPAVAEVIEVHTPDLPSVEEAEEPAEADQFNPTYNIVKRPARTAKADRTEPGTTEASRQEGEVSTAPAEESTAAAVKDAGKSAGDKIQEKTKETWSDPFAEMEREDAAKANRFRSRLALSFEGAASGNDSDFGAYLGRISRMADGASSTLRTGITEQSTSAYGIPLSAGLGVRFYVAPRLSIGTGLTYSLLDRSFTGTYNEVSNGAVTKSIDGDVRHTMHYVGVPLKLYFDAVKTGSIKFYLFGGGAAEYCVGNSYTLHATPDNIVYKEAVKGFQYSVGAGLGVEFKIAEHLGLFFDPSCKYYFPSNHPKSVRTDKPYMVNFEAGLRFNL